MIAVAPPSRREIATVVETHLTHSAFAVVPAKLMSTPTVFATTWTVALERMTPVGFATGQARFTVVVALKSLQVIAIAMAINLTLWVYVAEAAWLMWMAMAFAMTRTTALARWMPVAFATVLGRFMRVAVR